MKLYNLLMSHNKTTKSISSISCNKKGPVNFINSKLAINTSNSTENCLKKISEMKKIAGANKPTLIAKNHIKSGNETTSQVINSVIQNQKVSITQEELNKLLNLPAITFDLPLNDHTKISFDKLIKQQYKRGLPGVYF
jgi:hypothetical protein